MDAKIEKMVKHRLKQWGLWLHVCDETGVGFSKTNTLAKIRKAQDHDWYKHDWRTWEEEEEINGIISGMGLLDPDWPNLFRSKFEFCEELEREKLQSVKWRIQHERFMFMRGAELGLTAYKNRVSTGIQIVANSLLLKARCEAA